MGVGEPGPGPGSTGNGLPPDFDGDFGLPSWAGGPSKDGLKSFGGDLVNPEEEPPNIVVALRTDATGSLSTLSFENPYLLGDVGDRERPVGSTFGLGKFAPSRKADLRLRSSLVGEGGCDAASSPPRFTGDEDRLFCAVFEGDGGASSSVTSSTWAGRGPPFSFVFAVACDCFDLGEEGSSW